MYTAQHDPHTHDVDIITRYGDLPLLSAAEERHTDLRKWAATRSCLRLMLEDEQGRTLLLALCESCAQGPPQIENFETRSAFFHLRKDIAGMLPDHELSGQTAELAALLEAGARSGTCMAAIDKLNWPTTLVIGLATLVLRQLGFEMKDAMADALAQWNPHWHERTARADPRLACNLNFSILRYLDSRDKLVTHNVRLAMKLARENRNRGIPLADLLQEGMAGLVRAAEKYDFRMGYRFSTYAYNWINQYIQRACAGNGSLITYPAHVNGDIARLHSARMQRLQNSGIDPDHATLAKDTGFSADKVSSLRQLTNITVALDEPLSDANERTLEQTLPDPGSDQFAELADQPRLARLIHTGLRELTELEQKVIEGRWGLEGKQALTLKQMAEQLNVSSEWVRQLEKSALAKLGENDVLRHVSATLDA